MGVHLLFPEKEFPTESINDSKLLAGQEEEKILNSQIEMLKSTNVFLFVTAVVRGMGCGAYFYPWNYQGAALSTCSRVQFGLNFLIA